jgi:hypothetical protein
MNQLRQVAVLQIAPLQHSSTLQRPMCNSGIIIDLTLDEEDEEIDQDVIVLDSDDEEPVVYAPRPPISAQISSTLKARKKDSDTDHLLAQRLAAEEEADYKALLESVHSRDDGIVFSLAINASDNTLDDGSLAHQDDLDRFAPWKALFESTSCGIKVKKFHWFVNHTLESVYERHRERIEAVTGQPAQELSLFHGTREVNIQSILKGGFRIGGQNGHAVTNGTALGHGVYLAQSAATSIGYAMGSNRIFACKGVFLGFKGLHLKSQCLIISLSITWSHNSYTDA